MSTVSKSSIPGRGAWALAVRLAMMVAMVPALMLAMAACGGGSGASGAGNPPPPPPPACSAAPAVPSGLTTSGLSSLGVTLIWTASVPGPGCAVRYGVYRDGVKVLEVPEPRASLGGLAPETNYALSVTAINGFGSSARSAALTVTTPAGGAINPAIQIRTWVPSYSQSVWKAALGATTGGAFHPRNTLTSIGAQFFRIDASGGVHLSGSASDLQWVSEYCRSHRMKFLLCVTDYNPDPAVDDWDWPLAISAFETHRADLVENLVAAVGRWGADGVNIDFEGIIAEGVARRPAFAAFLRDLGARLHADGKELSVAVFPAQWNAPAITWIGDWVGSVDAIDSMGYDGLFGGPGDAEWNSYRWQQDTAMAAGYTYGQFGMGMPGWMGEWGKNGLGTGVAAHLEELRSGRYNAHPTSICIWDAQFNGTGWLSAEVWQALHALRTLPPPAL